ncbi:MAG: uncharacterized protein QG595_2011 [Pseudomonadota bacterium]|nr:uncharacterized protein [Pseudomonadota bacterium]
MPRKFLRRLSVAYREKHEQQPWYLRPFASLLHHPVYLSINRRSITRAMAIGLFVAMLPMPGHTPLALLLGLLLRANLPVALLVIWVANPVTYAPILYGEYLLGNYLLGVTPGEFSLGSSWAELRTLMEKTWRPLWFGAIVSGLLLAVLGYGLSNAAWRAHTLRRYGRRIEERKRHS